jgi:hypothetical protein
MSKNIGRHNMIVERVSISNIDNMEEYDFFEKEILILFHQNPGAK